MLKLFSRKKQATNRQEAEIQKQLSKRRMLHATYFFLAALLLLFGWQALKKATFLPIEQVVVRTKASTNNFANSSTNHSLDHAVKTIVGPYLHAGFFNVDIDGIRQSLIALPWIKQVDVTRIWPHKLEITLTEQQAIAMWQGDQDDTARSGLLNPQGQLFSPNKTSVPADLPLLQGPQSQQEHVFALYQTFNQLLKPLDLTVKLLNLSQRQAISVILSNKIELILGKEDIMPRMQRFVAVYPTVLAAKSHQIRYVDMCYTNGMAVKYKNRSEQR